MRLRRGRFGRQGGSGTSRARAPQNGTIRVREGVSSAGRRRSVWCTMYGVRGGVSSARRAAAGRRRRRHARARDGCREHRMGGSARWTAQCTVCGVRCGVQCTVYGVRCTAAYCVQLRTVYYLVLCTALYCVRLRLSVSSSLRLPVTSSLRLSGCQQRKTSRAWAAQTTTRTRTRRVPRAPYGREREVDSAVYGVWCAVRCSVVSAAQDEPRLGGADDDTHAHETGAESTVWAGVRGGQRSGVGSARRAAPGRCRRRHARARDGAESAVWAGARGGQRSVRCVVCEVDSAVYGVWCAVRCSVYGVRCTAAYCVRLSTVYGCVLCAAYCALPRTVYCLVLCTASYCVLPRTVYYLVLCTASYCVPLRTAYCFDCPSLRLSVPSSLRPFISQGVGSARRAAPGRRRRRHARARDGCRERRMGGSARWTAQCTVCGVRCGVRCMVYDVRCTMYGLYCLVLCTAPYWVLLRTLYCFGPCTDSDRVLTRTVYYCLVLCTASYCELTRTVY